jgi:lipid-A-disaccharide synthase
MRYYILAGEASGDLHASNLMKELKKSDPDADFRCWGGDLMQKQGGILVKHYRDLAFMGFAEVLANLFTILKNLSFCKKDILQYWPDVLILIDYPGFNLKIAKFAHQKGIKVFYYISPQVWAWKKSRVKSIRRDVDRMFVILPFEKDFYKSCNVDVDFVGHPLLDAIESELDNLSEPGEFRKKYGLDERPLIALLPGSRKQEISKMLRVMLSMVPEFPDFQFVVAGAPSVSEDFYRQVLSGVQAKIVFDATHDLLKNALAALVTSGTATLEAALMNVPEVVCYKGNNFSYQIARRIVKVKFISLVNLIMDSQIVVELIQDDFNSLRLQDELRNILDYKIRAVLFDNYKKLKNKLGGVGASEKVAKLMISYLKN